MKVYYFVILVFAFLAGSVSAENPQVTVHITGAVTGDIVLELYKDEAPVTVENFINYDQSGFYDGLIFHRVMPGFMVQGGGFDQTLNYMETSPPIVNESTNSLSNLRGTIAMARTTNPDTATAQFFINHADNVNLNRSIAFDSYNNAYYKIGYCVFGAVINGMETVDAIAAIQTETVTVDGLPPFNDMPVSDIIIQSAEITLNAPVCPIKMSGDIDGDCDVDLANFAKLAENWLSCNSITLCQ